ncbi:RNA polymerase sigma factor [Conexibacter sp. SYSU D00693]|uniref:RNA polymerase sigma factor n=1 Tax=Conexibacter sp. SYSU D00693 TaxID=2812560 RepID=UPI00196A279B|nr:RNA polymerase sigma factor [Conexibacter sp. SYSU D00693]
MPAHQGDDRLLAQRTSAGDDEAFAAIVHRHRAPLVRFVAKRTGRPELAEDAVQEALLAAHRALRGGSVPDDLRPWLRTIAARRAIDLARRERDAVPLDDARCVLATPASTEPEAAVAAAAELDRVVATWSELPPRQRRALALSVLEGRSLREIADAFDVDVVAAKSLVARSRRTLVHRLGDEAHTRRRRPRVLVLAPHGLLVALGHRFDGLRERLRDLIVLLPGSEPQISLVAKGCAAACISTVGLGGAVPVATVAPPVLERAPKVERDRPERKAASAPRKQPAKKAPAATSQTPATTYARSTAAPATTTTRVTRKAPLTATSVASTGDSSKATGTLQTVPARGFPSYKQPPPTGSYPTGESAPGGSSAQSSRPNVYVASPTPAE